MARKTTETFVHEVEGEKLTFQVHKMNALDGSFLLKFVAEKIIPLIDGFQAIFVAPEGEITEENIEEIAKKRTDSILEVVPKALASISKEELFDFEKQCLNNVDLLLPAGYQKVMSGGSFGVEEVEYDPILALILCYDVVQFNFSGFFAGRGLSSLLPNLNTNQ